VLIDIQLQGKGLIEFWTDSMGATVIKFGDYPPGIGGDYEQEVVDVLRNKLSHRFLILSNLSLPTQASFFYEYDIVVLSDFLCDVLEVKYLYSFVDIYEDRLSGLHNHHLPNVFSILENKTKVINGRLKREPFSGLKFPWPHSRVLVGPKNIDVRFKYKDHKINKKVVTLQEAIKYYREAESSSRNADEGESSWQKVKQAWKLFSDNSRGQSKHMLGKFCIRKLLNSDVNFPEYSAIDELPYNVDVHLKEYPFEPVARVTEIESYLKEITKEMQVLRSLRHQYIRCVTGHFLTGYSLVQVSDWFNGRVLEEKWQMLSGFTFNDKLDLMIKIAQALTYCHSRGVFHRNIIASNILVNEELDDIRITGFEFAKDFELTNTITNTEMNQRDGRTIPPEELQSGRSSSTNYRLYDIYQLGLLLFRIVENGKWPFDDAYDYVTGGAARTIVNHNKERGFEEIKNLILGMISCKPGHRPDPMQRIENTLNDIIVSIH
jgi:serine/threonine protein kinase